MVELTKRRAGRPRRFNGMLLILGVLVALGACEMRFDQDYESEDSIACRDAGYEIGSDAYEQCLIDRQTGEPE
jgi:hypothetical protein